MKSYQAEFTWRELLGLIAGPIVCLALFSAALRLSAGARLLPPPRPALDADRAIILHQLDASRAAGPAEVLLLGDSSCLMDVSARRLEGLLARSVLNLGLVSYLDLDAYRQVALEFIQRHPGQVKTIVLLMHPEALRRSSPETYHTELVSAYLAEKDHCRQGTPTAQISCALGVEIFKGRIWTRAAPTPLEGAMGQHYGFTWNLEDVMQREKGSLIDPARQPLEGGMEYRISAAVREASARFRNGWPAGVRLVAGITPVPERLATADFPARRDALLRDWSAALQADIALTNLPPSRPDVEFARATHLKAEAVEAFTAALGEALLHTLAPSDRERVIAWWPAAPFLVAQSGP